MRRTLGTIILGLILFAASQATSAAEGGVHPLRGRWDLTAEVPEVGGLDLQLLVVEVAEDPDDPTAELATGCLVTLETGVSTPMSLRAVDTGGGSSDVTFFGTVVGLDVGPAVTRFDGTIHFGGSGVADDVGSGDYEAEFGEGAWEGDHHDRRKPKCADVDPELVVFSGDAYTAQDDQVPPSGDTLLEAFTQFVSSGLQIESASFGTLVAPPFTDIFSPGVDFVSEFRFLGVGEGLPAIGEEFTFTLLDIFGEPIPGAQSTDVWNGCFQGAPGNVQGSYVFEDHIALSWDPVAPVPGFNPGAGMGFYQLESNGGYGGNSDGGTTSHQVPWAPFGGFAPGSPDGFDFGHSLSEFGDGTFEISVIAFADDVGSGGVGLACQVRGEPLTFEISGSAITIPAP